MIRSPKLALDISKPAVRLKSNQDVTNNKNQIRVLFILLAYVEFRWKQEAGQPS